MGGRGVVEELALRGGGVLAQLLARRDLQAPCAPSAPRPRNAAPDAPSAQHRRSGVSKRRKWKPGALARGHGLNEIPCARYFPGRIRPLRQQLHVDESTRNESSHS